LKQQHPYAWLEGRAIPLARAVILTLLVSLSLVFVLAAGAAPAPTAVAKATPVTQGQGSATPSSSGASDSAGSSSGTQATPAAPKAVTTAAAPNPVATGALPSDQATVQAGVQNATGSNGAANDTNGNAGPSTSGAATGSGFPWLPFLGVVLVVLVGLGLFYAYLRSRRPVEASVEASPTTVAAGSRAQPYIPGGTTTTSTTTSARTTAPGVAPAATVASAAMAPAPAAPAAPPVTVKCPNCGTINDVTENFCHECGEDLRPARAAALAAAAPPPSEAVTDETPYLETLDRVDEQLEYVLARARVLIGTAPQNDIVIDSAFRGWQTVSPVHAELRQQNEGFVIVDRDSETGTFVNDVRAGESALADGNTIRLGDVRFIFRVPQANP
jgi:FHA domain